MRRSGGNPAASFTGTQSVSQQSPGAHAKIALSTVVGDNMGWWDASALRYIPQRRGLYLVAVAYNGTQQVADQGLVDVVAYKNGAATFEAFMRWIASGSSYGPNGGASGLILMNGTSDYLELWGGTTRVGGLTGSGFLGVVFAGSA